MNPCNFDTFRYVRIKFSGTARWYTYRCAFEVKKGDVVSVPTCYGDNVGVVMDTSADETWGFPTAKWVHGFSPAKHRRPWPKAYRVRSDADPDYVLYANQTKRCLPGEAPGDHELVGVDMAAPVNCRCVINVVGPHGGRLSDHLAQLKAYDYSAIERRVMAQVASGFAVPSHLLSGRRSGKSEAQRLMELMKGYGMGNKLVIKRLKQELKTKKAEVAELEKALSRAKDEKRLAKIEKQLTDAKAEVEYREKFAALDFEGREALVNEALEIKRRLAE
ncbi:hypothetical protein ELZ19_06905 [Brucella abortus]|uniref:hypothetical protein n=1 Tax=Brucella abortus TaxID=235 RepID=UPI0005C7DB44|nr:hypothetical protein [Brucella abortus]RUQ67300.1 hypothetical protein ELZ23_15335 [Brucella abortus]RUQ78569.1 hypothetical protein ELZ22_16990 [Brucella abortus]RUQ88311.1 hypothetical protein ELZ18_15745 [Brucella abortus]RUQ90341.1 hypothetical protein ELZ20_15745 [Brucella abortus]RUQ96505.1 hypothetical protein ELZ21_15440 [Brucella abortus]